MTGQSIEPNEFIQSVQPLLAQRDIAGLTCLLRSRWTAGQITDLLASPHEDARKVAAVALSLVGGKCCIKHLAGMLADPDPVVNQLAEHALWSIWLRGGSPEANHELSEGHQSLNHLDFGKAVEHFTRAIDLDDGFAEAWNQRALAEYLRENWEASVEDCRQTLERMPCHFGAAAGMGHCLAHLGRTDEAIAAYEQALRINPHMECIAQGLVELRKKARRHEGA